MLHRAPRVLHVNVDTWMYSKPAPGCLVMMVVVCVADHSRTRAKKAE
jgi:hypothetical protein